jgi:teichuronic acid biosynthesis glycosyltransferase TuaG
MSNFKVSIITALYNAEDYIEETICSVLNQDYQNWELILVDDMSIDNSSIIVKKYINIDERIKYLYSNKKLFACGARNLGTDMATGKFIAFLDSDDKWHPNKLTKQVAFMLKNDLSITFTGYDVIDSSGKFRYKVFPPSYVDYKKLLSSGNSIGCLTLIYDCNIMGKQYFLSSKYLHEDYILWLNILRTTNIKIYSLYDSLAYYRIHRNSKSHNKFKSFLHSYLIWKNIERIPLHKRVFYSLGYIFYGLKKRLV